ncbi:4-coumarate-CoA ligase [Thraustotheca clavata]|uniref:4-coumarate-CoA ligase n=1 Tax=Thraustotheca clavata TaxID=74557 RepID=A0A1V9ZV00_9STRA|nr:4-coumarate-CoA ligase [Thraustotheca clavata]
MLLQRLHHRVLSTRIFKSPLPPLEFPQKTTWQLIQEMDDHFHKPAVVCGVNHTTITFGELVDKVNAIATSLSERGIGKGDVVLTNSVNCIEYPLICQGVDNISTISDTTTALGAILSPAPPLFRGDELAIQMKAANAKLVITHHTVQDAAKDAIAIAPIDKNRQFCIGPSDHFESFDNLLRPKSRVGDYPIPELDLFRDVSHLPFSSGTTGPPKGVKLSFHNMTANALQSGTAEKMGSHALTVLPYYHIYAGMLLNMFLLQGVAQVTLPKFEPEIFLTALEKYKIEKAHIVPPIAAFLAKHPLVDKYDLSATKILISGAAPMGEGLQEEISKRLGCIMKQAYGMTELSPVVNYSLDGDVKTGSSGKLVFNTELRVVCPEKKRDLDVNEVGELWYRGPQAMLGYLNNDEATKSTVTDCGFVKTGDIGYIDEDHHVFIVDRLKELIKYKGHQIAPAELEDVVLSHPSVADVGCIRGYDEKNEEVPKACVVLKEGHQLTEQELMEYTNSRVAPFKKIRQVVFINAIPKSASGKILRRELQAQYK